MTGWGGLFPARFSETPGFACTKLRAALGVGGKELRNFFLQLCEFSKLKHLPSVGSGATSEPDERVIPADSEAEARDGKMLIWGENWLCPKSSLRKAD